MKDKQCGAQIISRSVLWPPASHTPPKYAFLTS